MCEIIVNLLLKELVLEGLLARVGAGALEALLVLAVVLGHLPHLRKGKCHFRSKQLWFRSNRVRYSPGRSRQPWQEL